MTPRLLLGLLLLSTLIAVVPVSAQDAAEPPVLAMLALIPDTLEARTGFITYVDYFQIADSRPGAVRPTSAAEYLVAQDSDSPGYALWWAAFNGINSGPRDLVQAFRFVVEKGPQVVGFDFFEIHRAIEFGQPPANGVILAGDFDAAAIRAAPVAALVAPRLSPESKEKIIEKFKADYVPLPPYRLATIADTVDGGDQIVLVALAYPDTETAEAAGEIIQSRLQKYTSLVAKRPFTELLAERGATMESSRVYVSESTGTTVLVLAFHAPMPPEELDENIPTLGGYRVSSLVYRLFVDALFRRDLNWLAIAG